MNSKRYCKKCITEVTGDDEVFDCPGIFECNGCGYPHAKNELLDDNTIHTIINII